MKIVGRECLEGFAPKMRLETLHYVWAFQPYNRPLVRKCNLRYCLRLFCILSSSFLFMFSLSSADDGWSVIKDKHFLVYHMDNASFAQKVARSAENYYDKLIRDFGFSKHDNFWLWDDRAKIYVYKSREQYMTATGAPNWSAGKADYERKEITTFQGSSDFLDTLLPHELTHLIFRDFIGFSSGVPLWLDEGVAQWAQKTRKEEARRFAKFMYHQKKLISLKVLTRLNTQGIKDKNVAIRFYAQSVSLVGFLVEEHGSDKFRKFCGHLRDHKPLDDALRFTYPNSLRNMDALEKAWLKYLEEAK